VGSLGEGVQAVGHREGERPIMQSKSFIRMTINLKNALADDEVQTYFLMVKASNPMKGNLNEFIFRTNKFYPDKR